MSRRVLVALIALACGCSHQSDREPEGAGGAPAIPCEMCNAYAYSCVSPGVESTTLVVDQMADGGCLGTHLGPVELRCNPAQYCASGHACLDVNYADGGTIQFGSSAYCFVTKKRMQ